MLRSLCFSYTPTPAPWNILQDYLDFHPLLLPCHKLNTLEVRNLTYLISILRSCAVPSQTNHELVILTKRNHLRDTKHTVYIFFPTVLSIFGKKEKHEKVRTLYPASITKVPGCLVNDSHFCVIGLSTAGHCWHPSFFPGLSTYLTIFKRTLCLTLNLKM